MSKNKKIMIEEEDKIITLPPESFANVSHEIYIEGVFFTDREGNTTVYDEVKYKEWQNKMVNILKLIKENK